MSNRSNRPLIIVESPTKARTISRFMKAKYDVKASMGHIRDLPKSKLGVDIEDGFKPQYITIRAKQCNQGSEETPTRHRVFTWLPTRQRKQSHGICAMCWA